MGEPLRVDVISDVVCPWCLIGTVRLEQALAQAGMTDAEVRFHPFLLDPTTPPEGVDLRDRLRRKYRLEPDTMFGRVEDAARQSGIPLDFSKVRWSVNTVRAHTLLRHAAARGTQRALARALFEAYFLEGKDIGDPRVLTALGAAHGLAENQVRALLDDEAELEATRVEAAVPARNGVAGVPFFVFGGRVALSGAQSVETFLRAIARARQAPAA